MAPDWTDLNVGDPGVTLVTLFDFIADGLAEFTGIGGTHGSRRSRVLAAAVLVGLGLFWVLRRSD